MMIPKVRTMMLPCSLLSRDLGTRITSWKPAWSPAW
jgi:hypothetical protein